MLNKVQLIGNVGQDPEIRQAGSARVANLSIATTEKWTDKQSGERKEKTEWHRVTIWGDGLVNVVEKWVNKGDKLYIEGALETRKWQDKEGNDRYTTEIVVRGFGGNLQMLGGKSGGDTSGSHKTSYNQDHQAPPSSGPVEKTLDDEIPF